MKKNSLQLSTEILKSSICIQLIEKFGIFISSSAKIDENFTPCLDFIEDQQRCKENFANKKPSSR